MLQTVMAFSVPVLVASKGVRRDHSRAVQNLVDAKHRLNAASELFCNKCLQKHLIKEAYGFCKVCMDFLCRQCVTVHDSTLLTLNHGVVVGQEMTEKYQHAMRKDRARSRAVSRSYLDMVADGRASIEYLDGGEKARTRSQEELDDGEVKHVKDINISVSSDRRKCFICACVVYEDGRIVLADANNKALKLFNKHYRCLHVFNMKGEPWDATKAVDLNSDMFVSECTVEGIHQFKVSQEIKYVFTLKVNGACFGVTNWANGIAASVKKDRIFTVQLLDQYGNIHRKIEAGLEGTLKLKSPWYLTSINNGKHIIISDAGTSTITCIAVDGGIKFAYKNIKKLADPRNTTSDEDDNIYVVDYERDLVRQLSATGEDLGVILCQHDGLASPGTVGCHGDRIYIQAKMDTNSLNVFSLP